MNCYKCESEKAGESVVKCATCGKSFHLSCMEKVRRLRTGDKLCDECCKDPGSVVDTLSGADTSMYPRGNSTMASTNSDQEEIAELKLKLAQMQRLFTQLEARLEKAEAMPGPSQTQESQRDETVAERRHSDNSAAQGAVREQVIPHAPMNNHNMPNLFEESGCVSVAAFERTQWRSRLPEAVLQRCGQHQTLTKEQLARRKSMNTVLPRFNGNPLKWLSFITAYMDTAGPVCGFTPGEDMDRLRAALYGPALDLVRAQMGNIENLDGVLGTLQLSFGETHMILSAMEAKVSSLTPLNDRLDNIASFAGQVDQLRSINNLLAGKPHRPELIKRIVSKLPLRYGEEWLIYKSSRAGESPSKLYQSMVMIPSDGNLNDLADFLLYLHERSVNLGRNLPPFFDDDEEEQQSKPKPKKKPILVVAECERDEASGVVYKGLNGLVKKRDTASPALPSRNECGLKCGNREHVWSVCPAFKKMSVPARWAKVKRSRRCFGCFGAHKRNECTSTALCSECNRPHHPLLHPQDRRVEEAVSLYVGQGEETATFLRTLPVRIRCGDRVQVVLAVLDSGSSCSLIDGELARELNLSGQRQSIALSWTNGVVQPALTTQVVQVELGNVANGDAFVAHFHTYEGLKLPNACVKQSMLQEEELNHLPVVTFDKQRPLLLIGQDNAAITRTVSSATGVSPTLIVSETPLGFVVEGERVVNMASLLTHMSADKNLEAMLERFIEGEHFGLQPDSNMKPESDDVRRARTMMETHTVQRVDGRYETALLWKDDAPLPFNRAMALQRHRSFEKKLQRDPELYEKVRELMRSHLKNGYIRVADDSCGEDGRKWFLPVFNVHNPAKPGKVRLVFDCAAKFEGVSLNDRLLSGPDLTAPLVMVLQQFRTRRIGVSGDLQDMYHRVYIREEDRCSQKFVWREHEEEPLLDYEMCVLTFGATCSPSLAQYVKNQHAERYRETHQAAVEAICGDHYVDDWLGGADTEEETLQLALQVKWIHEQAGFHMHKWVSNSRIVLSGLHEEQPETEVSLSNSAILGMKWNTADDSLSFLFRHTKFREDLLNGSGSPTKREMLKVVMSIYDPLGLVSFLTVEARLILREAWREEADWDDELRGGLQRRWAEWTSHLRGLSEISIPRWHGTEVGHVDLHVFVDASEAAISAVCYVVQSSGTRVISNLCMAKCLVAPLKTKSIPRLELDAAVLGTRVAEMVKKTWTVNRIVYWSDARDVIWWINCGKRRYTPYVANRVAAILTVSEPGQWRWTPTDQNPADWGTKWADRTGTERLWWNGPEFLQWPEEQWPAVLHEPERLLELKPLLLVVKKHAEGDEAVLVPDVNRFSKWTVFLNATAYALKFCQILKKREYPGPLGNIDRQRAEVVIFKEVQKGMQREKSMREFLTSVAPFIDQDGVLRMRGRAARSKHLPFDARFPIIVREHPIVVLLVEFYHRLNGHQNTTTVVNELRQKIVMPHLRAVVKRVISHCRMCCVRRAAPVVPQMSALPTCRMALYMPPFSYTGVDYFGPLTVAVGRRHEKRWGVLFTCLTTRAVYLETVHSLSAEACMGALDSLVARRGMPLEMHSDNATCFVRASKDYVGPAGSRLVWRFIPPRCPSMGGAWERLVGATKKGLESLQLSKTPSDEKLRQGLALVERLLNSRPLTEVPVDEEEEECLTPNHFLVGSSNGLRGIEAERDCDLAENFGLWNELVDSFWRRFIVEYMPTISKRAKWHKKVEPLQEGDMVLTCDDDYRTGWQRGIVTKVLVDKESDQVRHVTIRTADGKEVKRAAAKVAKIGVRVDKM